MRDIELLEGIRSAIWKALHDGELNNTIRLNLTEFNNYLLDLIIAMENEND